MAILGRRARPRPPEKKLSANSYKPSLANKIMGLLPIEWVIFRNSDVMAVFDDDTLADR
jgi:hypothetical protein